MPANISLALALGGAPSIIQSTSPETGSATPVPFATRDSSGLTGSVGIFHFSRSVVDALADQSMAESRLPRINDLRGGKRVHKEGARAGHLVHIASFNSVRRAASPFVAVIGKRRN